MSGVSDDSIQQFMALANCSLAVAQKYLEEFGDLTEALNAYYAAESDPTSGERARHTPVPERTPISRAASTTSTQSAAGTNRSGSGGSGNRSKFMSFADMVKGQTDDDDDDPNRNTFAGGETSGLEVTDPNDSNSLIKDLLEKARKGAQQQPDESPVEKKPVHHFTGRGYKLGSAVDAPSEVTADVAEEALPARPQKVTREITFWKEGFQVGDGPLYRYDDPANSFYLNELNQGRAPLKLLDVQFGQEVDVNVYKKLEESYQPPKRKIGGFTGHGQRLGSPIPGDFGSTSVEPGQPQAETSPNTQEEVKKEEPKGDSSVQIRYASGKREVYRCYSTDTVQSLYDHVRENTQDNTRKFTLNYAFPVKPLENFGASLKEAGLINTVVVQRWV